jgi:hypothetical protein
MGGWCPVCSQPLSSMTTGGKGLCEFHGWQFANYGGKVFEFSAWVRVFAPNREAAQRKIEETNNLIESNRRDVELSLEDSPAIDVTDDWDQ